LNKTENPLISETNFFLFTASNSFLPIRLWREIFCSNGVVPINLDLNKAKSVSEKFDWKI